MKTNNMQKCLFVIIIICHLKPARGYTPSKRPRCLTGYMTDVQTWVDENGRLLVEEEQSYSIDLSAQSDPVATLQMQMGRFTSSCCGVKYLSLARCGLTRIPPIFNLKDGNRRRLADSVEYLSFYGNSFSPLSKTGDQYSSNINATDAVEESLDDTRNPESSLLWSAGFQDVTFPRLKELDLRACNIQVLGVRLFIGMRNLEAIYIGENIIHTIELSAFDGLQNLAHVDFSGNQGIDSKGSVLNLQADAIFANLSRLVTLDLSYTSLTQRNMAMFRDLSNTLKSISICNTGLTSLPPGVFNKTSLEVLDVSQNNGILSQNGALRGLENTLRVLYSNEVGLQTFDTFMSFKRLEILQLIGNEISVIKPAVIRTLEALKILDLDKNRVTTWFESTYTLAPELAILNLRDNNINLILEDMVSDIANVSYVGLSGNFIVCNCHAKYFIDVASMNEEKLDFELIEPSDLHVYHTGYMDYNKAIKRRPILEDQCEYDNGCKNIGDSGRFRLFDYYREGYTCLMVPGSKSIEFGDIDGCSKFRDLDFDGELETGRRAILALLAIPCFLLPLVFIFVFRRNLKYCLITMRNSAMIGLINKNSCHETTIFNYDVFVSYCNEDRGWVLDNLLPHLESDCSISACLHERDFQVGLSILENIVSCMDRSKSIMLILSQQFLLSQWCQFEMHLAQHRLLETRREDLVLVLLEDIPRRLRPNTLHYLMMTKTYIVWPKEDAEKPLFWKRLQKSLLTHKMKYTDNASVV